MKWKVLNGAVCLLGGRELSTSAATDGGPPAEAKYSVCLGKTLPWRIAARFCMQTGIPGMYSNHSLSENTITKIVDTFI